MNPYRADVIGSMLRPQYLLEARESYTAGKIRTAEFKAVEDLVVDEAIATQERAGVDVVTDGKMRRNVFASQLVQSCDGFDCVPNNEVYWFTLDGRVERSPVTVGVVSKLERKRQRHLSSEEYVYLRAKTSRPKKITLPSPTMYAYYWVPGVSNAAYSNTAAYLADVAAGHDECRKVLPQPPLACSTVPQWIRLLASAILLDTDKEKTNDSIQESASHPSTAALYHHDYVSPKFLAGRHVGCSHGQWDASCSAFYI